MVAVGVHFETKDVLVGWTHERAVVPFSVGYKDALSPGYNGETRLCDTTAAPGTAIITELKRGCI